jgi:putative DNA primase/helicase
MILPPSSMNGDGDDGHESGCPATVVVPFPVPDEERARRCKAEAERLARMSPVEWTYYVELEGYAEKFGVDKTTLKAMVEAVIKEIEKKKREDRGERRHREVRAEKKQAAAIREEERREREARREEERKEREARKEAERKEREKQKALAAIVKLPSGAHEAELKKLARRLGEAIESLREDFAVLLDDEAEKIRRGIVEPWDEPVDTRELLDAASAQFGKYIIIHDKIVAPIVPLWTAFAWVHDIAVFSPLLIFQGADTGMGKSAASEVVSRMSPRGYMIVKPTGPALYRLVDRLHPTLFIDDADKLLAEDRDLATIVRASWKRGVYVPRTVKGEVHFFDAFGSRCLNGIDLLAHLDVATRARCITVQLLPKLEEESVTSLRYAEEDENFVILRRKFLRWATDNMVVLKSAKPRMPDGFHSRLEENYHLLFAIAELAGGDWPKKAHAAAVKLSREHNEPSLGKRALAIFFSSFIQHGPLLTSKQTEQLFAAADDAFADYKGRGRPINKYEIAALVKPYQVFPGTIHLRGRPSDRGWNAAWFATAFKHYLGKTLPAGRAVVRKSPKKPSKKPSK